MSILLPLVPGLAYNLGEDSGFGGLNLMLLSIGCVLEGSIFGDHCSPISDTTVLSSTASACDHIDHVRTQLPYALMVLALSILVGYLPVATLGVSPWACLLVGGSLLFFVTRFVARSPDGTPA
jgi:Na+/H+ antiporter NhaC